MLSSPVQLNEQGTCQVQEPVQEVEGIKAQALNSPRKDKTSESDDRLHMP